MNKQLLILFLGFISFNLFAQEIERTKSNLPEISEVRAILNDAAGWVLQENGRWLSEKNKIMHYKSELNLAPDEMQKLGQQNFEQMELFEVLIGDEQFVVLLIKYKDGYFEFPALRENFVKTENARYVVFHAKKIEEILASAGKLNEATVINLEVFCSDNITNYDKKEILNQVSFNILRVSKLEEPSKFTMILASMPAISNGAKVYRFRYLNLFNQESIYHQYLLPANKAKHFERSYYELPYQAFIDFFGSIKYKDSDFNLLNPKTLIDFYKRGLLRFERENYQGALSDFKSALKIEPETNLWIIHAQMGSTLHKLKEFQAAIKSFEKAIFLIPEDESEKPEWLKNYYNLGLSYLMLNKKEEACANFKQAKLLGIKDKNAIKIMKKNCKGKLNINKP